MKKVLNVVKPILSIVLALLVGAIVIWAIGENPIQIYQVMLSGSLSSVYSISETLLKATTLIFCGLSYAFAYKCGLINIGTEGQLYMGALFSTIISVYVKLPMLIHIPLALAAGFLGGAIWGGIVGFLKNRFGCNEIITTVMLNYVAQFLVAYMVSGPIQEKAKSYPQTDLIQDSAKLKTLVTGSNLNIGFFFAIAALILYYVFWKYTSSGYSMEIVGANQKAGQYAGMNVRKTVMLSMCIAGGFGGLAGSMEVMGIQHKLLSGLSAGYGFDGIAVSLLGGNSAIGIFLSSILFGALRVGGNAVQMFTSLPVAVIYIIQALVILFVVLDLLSKKLERRK